MDQRVVVTGTWEFTVPAGWVSSDGSPEGQDFTSYVGKGMATNPIAFLATRMTDPDNKDNWAPKALTAQLQERHLPDGSCCNEEKEKTMKTRLALVLDADATLLELQSATLTQEDIDDGCDPANVDIHDIVGCLYSGAIKGIDYTVVEQKSEEIDE